MFGFKKCSICGRYFQMARNNIYRVRVGELGGINYFGTTYDAIDCPKCGCQMLLSKREENVIHEE